jgi:pimeloyl-ACP methyl ester carboxylesterase
MKWVWQLLSCALVLVPARMHAEEDAFPLVTKRVQGWVDRGYYPGCSVWIAKGDKVLYQKNFGTGTADTEVYIASSGKWLAAAAILAVVDEGKLSLDDQAEKWLPEFKGDPKAHLIGLSLGAFVVTDFLALHPERVMTATIASGGAYAGPGSRAFVLDDAAKAKILAGIEALRKEGMEAEKYRWLDHLVGTAGPRAETVRPALAEMIGDWSAWQPLHIEPPHVLGAAALDLLAKTPCDVPVELLAGANDPNVIQAFGKFTAVLPHAQIHILPDTGHLLNMERPAAFLDQITDFMSSNTTYKHQ